MKIYGFYVYFQINNKNISNFHGKDIKNDNIFYNTRNSNSNLITYYSKLDQ